MRIRLVRKLALSLNGVDVSQLRVGEVAELPDRSARLLLIEGWAERVRDDPPTPLRSPGPSLSES